MQKVLTFIETATGIPPDVQVKVFSSIAVVFVLWLIRFIVLIVVWRQTDDAKARYLWRKTLSYVIVFLSILFVGNIWFKSFHALDTYLGLLSAGIAIALRDPLINLTGWLFIIVRRPLAIGDRVEVAGTKGDVIDIRAFQFTLLEIGNWVDAEQSTGRIVHIPNGKVFTETLANYSKGFKYIWNEIPILVTFESNWQKAKGILATIAHARTEQLTAHAEQQVKEASKKFLIFYNQLTPTVYTVVKESGVLLTIRYLCEPRRRRNSEESIWEDILLAFGKENDVDFAYPTQRFYDHAHEGKTVADAHAPHHTKKTSRGDKGGASEKSD